MAEENKDKAEGAKPKKEAPQAEAPAPSGKKKNKKINQMTLAEIEAKLAGIKQTQGGLVSGYARQLIRRKKTLGS
jgi:hypothetical protein